MADILPGLNASTFGEIIWSSMPPQFLENLSFLFTVAKAASILFVVYLVFLIVKAVIQARQALRIKAIEKYLAEISKKLDQLVDHKKKNAKE